MRQGRSRKDVQNVKLCGHLVVMIKGFAVTLTSNFNEL